VVSVASDALLADGQRALEAGEWSAARSSFEAALEVEESPAALLGLGNALWWLDETEASLRCRERAYTAFRHGSDPFQATTTALQLAYHYGANLGDVPAARGWGMRAARLVEDFQLAPLEGWVLLSQAAGASSGGDPRAGEGFARQARELARRFGDTDLELCALSQIGGALVLMGRVEDGALLLDEAMAGALGGEGAGDGGAHQLRDDRLLQPRGRAQESGSVDSRRQRVQSPLWLAALGRRVPHGLWRGPAGDR
jgi:tetratricopeptide (TPR) repeat protein